MADGYISQITLPNNNTYLLKDSEKISAINASGTAPLTLSSTKSGTTYTLTGSVADASFTTSGIVNTSTQVFGGGKTLRFTSRIYPLIGTSAERSQWYKITFPYSTITTGSSAQWFMNSFDLHFGGGYASNPSGVAHVTFYWTRAANNGAWAVGQQAALIEGILANKIGLYYRIAEPGVLYVNNTANTYNGIWIDNLYVDDTAINLNWSTITITATAAITESTSPKLSDYTKITTSYLYNDGGTLKTDSNFEGKYIKGTWLYTSAATAKTSTSKLATIESDNFIYYITPANALKSAIGTTAIGAAKTPIYWDGSKFTGGTALKNLAYKDSLTASDIPDLSGTYVKKVTSTDNAVVRFDGTGGQIQNSGAIIDDNNNISVSSILSNLYSGYNLCKLQTSASGTEIVIKTKFKFVNSATMPSIRIHGYSYGKGAPLDLTIVYYIYSNEFYVPKVISTGGVSPDIYLFTYTENSIKYVAIGIKSSLGYLGFTVDANGGALGELNINPDSTLCTTGWTIEHNGSNTSNTLIPAVNTDNCKLVPYLALSTTVEKTISANITSTTNAVAYYTDTTGKFGSKASANGALYATSANGALQWGTLPIAQGGTGKTSASEAWTALGGGASGKHADSYFALASHNHAASDINSGTFDAARIPNLSWSKITSGKPTTLSGYGITDAKIVSGVITLGSNTITPITSIADLTGSTITAANLRTNLGLSAALRFIGKATTDMSESTTTAPTVTGVTNYAPEVGDVVLDKNSDAEYVCIAKSGSTYTWELLGRSGSWATSTHTHGNITNGGLLTAASMAVVTDGSKKITTADLSVSDSNASTNATTTFVQAVTQSAQGKITVTKASLDTSGTWSGNAATATKLKDNATNTTRVFYRGDNTWSNILKQTSAAVLGIDTNSKIGTAVKDLHFTVGSGSGTGINDGNAGGITIGTDTASYGGIYWQSSGSYGLRLHFATTDSFANGAYTRMLIAHDGKVGIGTLSPDKLLTVNGEIKGTALYLKTAASDPSLSAGARIEFSYPDGQPVVLSYTPNDSYRAPAGLKILGGSSATPAWFEVEGGIYTNSYYHIDANRIDNGNWLTGATGKAPTATTTDGNTTYSGAVIGTSILTLGNNKVGANSASGVNNNAQGYLRLYSSGSAYGEVTAYSADKTRIYPTYGIALPPDTIDIMFRPTSSAYYTHISYQTSGNEALVAATQNSVTSFIFVNGESYANVAATRWTKLTGSGASGEGNAPGLQIKQNCVSIGELIPSGTNATYKLNVNGGQTRLNSTAAATSTNLSSQLIVSNSNSTAVALELWRNANASWQIANDSGILYIRNNWTTAKQNTYSQNGLIMDFNTGNTAIAGTLSVGQTTRNTSYKLYVNGTGYFNGAVTATSFTGDLTGNVTGNVSGSAGSVAWENTGHPATFTPSDHTHGNISNTGTISTSAAIANNDALVIAAATSGTVKKTSIVFDGSTTSQALTKKGTWGTFLTAHGSSYGKIKSGAASTTVTSISTNTATAESKSANETITIQAGNKWIQTGATNSSNAGSDVITLGHLVPDNAISNLSTTAQTPSFNSTFNIPTISLDEAGHVTGVGNTTVKIPALPSSVTPSSHKHGNINNDGTLGSTASYGVATDANKKIIAIDLSVSDPTASGNATTFVTSVTQSSQGKISVSRSTVPNASSTTAGIVKLGAEGGAAAYSHTHSYLSSHGPSYGGIQVSAQSTTITALTSSTAVTTVTAVGANETVKFVTKNKWIVIKGSNSATGGADEIQFAHTAGLTAKTSYCSTSATASANGGKITVTDIQYDEAGHITSTTDRTITLSQTTYTLSSLGAAASSHSHGNIANGGTIAVSTSSTIANGDTIVISTSANSGKLTRASITFDASTTTSYLNKKGEWGTPPDTKNTAGATNSTSALYLIGSTTQTANPQTYSNTYVTATNGVLSAKSFGVNFGTAANKVTLEWNNTDSALEFVFA